MAPTTFHVEGYSVLRHRAERAVLNVHVTSNGPEKETPSMNVITTAQQLQDLFKQHTASDGAVKDASITSVTMASITTNSHIPRDEKNQPLPREFTATTSFRVKFSDFGVLGRIAKQLATIEHVELRGVGWELTDETEASLASKCRRNAVKNALDKASDYTEALGLSKNLKVDEVNEGSLSGQNSTPWRHRKAAATAEFMSQSNFATGSASVVEATLKFEPEELQVSATVGVKFTI